MCRGSHNRHHYKHSFKSSIQGYYDCEHQIIFLHFRDSEQLLADLLKKSNVRHTLNFYRPIEF